MFSLQTQRMQGLGLDSEKASPYSEVKFRVQTNKKNISFIYKVKNVHLFKPKCQGYKKFK